MKCLLACAILVLTSWSVEPVHCSQSGGPPPQPASNWGGVWNDCSNLTLTVNT